MTPDTPDTNAARNSPHNPEACSSQSDATGADLLSFEDAFTKLDETVEALESGGLTLEAAAALYEEGMRLVDVCNRLLSTAELKITQLKDAYANVRAQGLADEGG